MEDRVERKLHELGVKAGDRVGVAVSGGVDSMVLLHTLCNLRDQLNIIVVAFHMEHGIRGQASEEDMRFVMRECARRGLECVVQRADAGHRAEAKCRWRPPQGRRGTFLDA